VTDQGIAVFRKRAVERLASPDESAEPLCIVRPADWLVLASLAVLIAAAVTWGLTARLPVGVRGEGILRRPGMTEVVAPQAGRVGRLFLRHGELVPVGAPLLELEPALAGQPAPFPRYVAAPFPARVLEWAVNAGDQVAAGAPLVTLEPGDAPLQAVLFVPEAAAGQVRPGQEVRLAPAARSRRYGPLAGTVSGVAPSPLTQGGLRAVLVADTLVAEFMARGLRIRVDVVLSARPSDPGWPSGSGSGIPLASRIEVQGEIVLGHERPMARVWPWLRSPGV
jgi:multidrug efflux pump subunit AcrA (membrane-fusion protein)